MDIQPCGSNESIAYYSAKYMSKAEPVELDLGIRRAVQLLLHEECNIFQRLFKICSAYPEVSNAQHGPVEKIDDFRKHDKPTGSSAKGYCL
ncbi:hypothetical protein AVEN_17686-1 [Araneus ventricosus]|uniref:Uncharacterized protein n=1 Tax=Araneus ventricosus TaxID=182803 RepID=A0A4Y2TZR0_ARAVE|nr:hypothetical protein AVEN_17686-1 [Araneus ventricosus]